NVAIFGTNKSTIETLVKEAGFTITERNPEIVLSFGGDGTLMRSEVAFPGVPKVALRDSSICKKCSALPNEDILRQLAKGEYTKETLFKLEARAKGKELVGLNDIIVHNKDPRHGIRYHLSVNRRDIGHEIVGDGIVVATPFGSTGYFRSITDSFFEIGIGIAFNNSTERFDHMIVEEENTIEMSITRGPAVVYADNHEDSIELLPGDKVTIQKSSHLAVILTPR
ncbi:MAG: hypothetical protein AAB944_02565, partial [Patescibacteria group bacterium]